MKSAATPHVMKNSATFGRATAITAPLDGTSIVILNSSKTRDAQLK
jgi:hypothetical protein